jgi:hypothetical protein
MHESQLTQATYTVENTETDAETPTPADSTNTDSGIYFQDIEVSPATLSSGELVRRFDPLAFPKPGVKYTGTDSDGAAFPKAAVPQKDTSY